MLEIQLGRLGWVGKNVALEILLVSPGWRERFAHRNILIGESGMTQDRGRMYTLAILGTQGRHAASTTQSRIAISLCTPMKQTFQWINMQQPNRGIVWKYLNEGIVIQ